MSFNGSSFAKLAFSAAIAASALSAAVAAHAEVSVSVGVGGPVYYEPAPAPAYVAPPPAYVPGYASGYYAQPSRPRLSDMQQRALDNCSLLAPHEQRRCRATVMSTVR